jgi:hypothetical protein
MRVPTRFQRREKYRQNWINKLSNVCLGDFEGLVSHPDYELWRANLGAVSPGIAAGSITVD